jgi:predicted transposase YdaD
MCKFKKHRAVGRETKERERREKEGREEGRKEGRLSQDSR